ncbi:hypothetical protein Aeq9CBH6_17460 [Adlercreutzia equolifaciens]|nr:hypothetical protein Aeq9CBH6_17460 [Adlercreutzia equolifaciens]
MDVNKKRRDAARSSEEEYEGSGRFQICAAGADVGEQNAPCDGYSETNYSECLSAEGVSHAKREEEESGSH